MEKYLNYDGLSKLWAKTKNQDTLTLNAAKNYTSDQITLAKNELQLKINGNSSSITTLNGYFSNGVANKALGDKNGNDITATYMLANLRGAANGVCPLGSDSKIPNSYLPSYVDDVLEYATLSNFPTTGEAGKIYVDKATNKTYRWSGSQYTEISSSLALGTTTGTAFDGGKGQALETKVSTIENNYVVKNYTNENNYEGYISNSGADISLSSVFGLTRVRVHANNNNGAYFYIDDDGNKLGLGIYKLGQDTRFAVRVDDNYYDILDTSMAITDAELEELLV